MVYAIPFRTSFTTDLAIPIAAATPCVSRQTGFRAYFHFVLDKAQALLIASSCQCQDAGVRQGQSLTFPTGGSKRCRRKQSHEQGFAEGKGDDESTEDCRAQHQAIADCLLSLFPPWDELLQARQLSCSRKGLNTPVGKSLGKWDTKSSLFTSTESRRHDENHHGRLGNVINLVSRGHNTDKVYT